MSRRGSLREMAMRSDLARQIERLLTDAALRVRTIAAGRERDARAARAGGGGERVIATVRRGSEAKVQRVAIAQ